MMADDCPYCRILADRMRSTADDLASFAGGVIGGRIAGPRGTLIGQELAPRIIEQGALKIASSVKRKRRQTKGQKKRSRAMSTAMKKASSKAKIKNGKFRKGWNQSRMMKYAHKICRG